MGERLLWCAALALVFCGLVSPCFATDTPITVPSLGVDWAGSVAAITSTVGTIIVAALGLWAGIKVVQAAKSFIGRATRGG